MFYHCKYVNVSVTLEVELLFYKGQLNIFGTFHVVDVNFDLSWCLTAAMIIFYSIYKINILLSIFLTCHQIVTAHFALHRLSNIRRSAFFMRRIGRGFILYCLAVKVDIFYA